MNNNNRANYMSYTSLVKKIATVDRDTITVDVMFSEVRIYLKCVEIEMI